MYETKEVCKKFGTTRRGRRLKMPSEYQHHVEQSYAKRTDLGVILNSPYWPGAVAQTHNGFFSAAVVVGPCGYFKLGRYA
jgi:hypothetical protein